jgi:hypothetical protein
MRQIIALGLSGLIFLAMAVAGCGPRLSKEDLGELQTEAADLPGAGEEYELPEPHFEAEGVTPDDDDMDDGSDEAPEGGEAAAVEAGAE